MFSLQWPHDIENDKDSEVAYSGDQDIYRKLGCIEISTEGSTNDVVDRILFYLREELKIIDS